MYGIAMLQMRCGTHPPIEKKMQQLYKDYPLSASAQRLCRIDLELEEPVDDNVPIDVELA